MTSQAKLPTTLKLTEPVEFEGVTYTEFTLRRMKAKDALIGEGETNETKIGYMTFAAMANVPLGVIEELDMDDLASLSEVMVPLMGKSAMAAAAEVKRKAEAAKAQPSDGETSSS